MFGGTDFWDDTYTDVALWIISALAQRTMTAGELWLQSPYYSHAINTVIAQLCREKVIVHNGKDYELWMEN